MRSVRTFVVVAVLTLALGALVPSASAGSAKPFHLTKTCSSDVLCTLVSDSFKAIPAGTDVTYTWDTARPWLAYPTIAVTNGSTTGVCDWNQPGPTVLAVCTFNQGTGRLTELHLTVDVSVEESGLWHWDGWYWLGG
jgi:hypothetical protein